MWSAAMDVGGWLRSLGLDQYEANFRDNKIDADVLPQLTVDDLKDIGVSAVGHRRRLLAAIASLGGTEPAAKPASPPPAPPSLVDVAERRQLTVMFCDLVGSTGLSARLDPEDMREIIRAYQDACSGAVARYDGFVAKFMGDGVLAYFGFPRAHEEDAERAVRAGLDIAAAVAKLDTPAKESLKVRIGIATGIVVVGDLVGQGSAQEQAVVGDTPNLAARLQGFAEPGSIVIAESTKRLLGGAFELKPLGPQTLKGFDAPVPAWTVMREAENVSRFEASRSQGMTPFVGREHETALLLDRWRDASERQGQVALITGEAGIGKSRILAALCERIGDEPHVRVRYQCSPHHLNDAFYPISRQIWHAAGLISGEPAAARLDKLEAMIARSGLAAIEIGPLLGSAVDPRRGQIRRTGNGPERTEGANDRGVDGAVQRADQRRPRTGAVRGRALDRPHVAGRFQPAGRSAPQSARVASDHLPPGVRRAVGRPRPCGLGPTQPLRAPAGAGDGRWRRRRQGAAGGSAG
jgi:class 3 adenylate cyclase